VNRQADLFDGRLGGQQAKREALERVARNAGNWMPRCLLAIGALADSRRGDLVTGEDIRLLLTPVVGDPHHHNTWGAAILMAIERGYLLDTEKPVPMRTRRSHARKTPLYRLV
jgi:hypothetical protein